MDFSFEILTHFDDFRNDLDIGLPLSLLHQFDQGRINEDITLNAQFIIDDCHFLVVLRED